MSEDDLSRFMLEQMKDPDWVEAYLSHIPEAQSRWFRWTSQWFYSWPIKIMRGEDEHGWRTLGIVTWAGSLFYRTRFCTDPECVEIRNEYWRQVHQRDLDDAIAARARTQPTTPEGAS